jgi:O-antigen ligase
MKFLLTRLEVLLSIFFLVDCQSLFLPPVPYFTNTMGSYDASDPFSAAVNIGMIALVGIGGFIRRDQMLPLLRPAWPILAMLVLAYASAFWSEDPLLVLRRATTLTGTSLFGIYLVARFGMSRFVMLIVLIGAFGSLASFAVLLFTPTLGLSIDFGYTTAWRGAYSAKNTLGMMTAIDMIFAVYGLWMGYGPRIIPILLIPANLILLRFANSGTPILMLVAALYTGLTLYALRQRNGGGLFAGYVMIVVGVLGLGFVTLDWTEVLLLLNRSPTLTGRLYIWRIVIQMIDLHPWLGYGYGVFWRHGSPQADIVWGVMHWPVPHAHNAWLETGLGLGIVGMVGLTLVYLGGFYRGLRLLVVPQARHIAFIMTLFVAILIENMTEYEFFRPDSFLWVLFVAGFVYVGREFDLVRAARVARPPRPPVSSPIAAIAYPGARPT